MNTIYIYNKLSDIMTIIDNYEIERYDDIIIINGNCFGKTVKFTSSIKDISTLEFPNGDGNYNNGARLKIVPFKGE